MLNESNALLRQAIDQHYSTSAPAIKQHVIRSLMQMPKPIDYPGLRERIRIDDPRHPLQFGLSGWKPEITPVLPLLRKYDASVRELKVEPRHRHHHWPRWAYEERHHEDYQARQGATESGHASGCESTAAGSAGTAES